MNIHEYQAKALLHEFGVPISRGVPVLRAPELEPWGLLEMWIADPDGVRIVLVQVPAEHPLRRDQR